MDQGLRNQAFAQQLLTPAQPDPTLTPENDPLNHSGVIPAGLSSGLSSAKAGLWGLGGTAADALGASDTAQSMYNNQREGLRSSQLAGRDLQPWSGVHNLGDFVNYAAGGLAQGAPMLATGLAAGMLTRGKGLGRLGTTLATTAANTPLMAGEMANRVAQDPQAMQQPAATRLATELGAGTAGAFGASLPIGALTNKLGAQALEEGAARQGLGTIIGKNAIEGVGGGAVGNTLGTAADQYGHTLLNPNRDTSGDQQELKESAITGAVMGAPFGALGAGAEALHNMRLPKATPEEAGTPLGGALNTAANRVRSLFGGKPQDPDQGPISLGKDVTPDGVENMSTDEAVHAMQQKDQSVLQKVSAWGQDMLSRSDIPDDQKAKLAGLMQTVGDRGTQAQIALMKGASDSFDRMKDNVGKLSDIAKTKMATDGDVPQNAQYTTLDDAIAQHITPLVQDFAPDAFNSKPAMLELGRTLHTLFQAAGEGKNGLSDPHVADSLFSIFGERTADVVQAVDKIVRPMLNERQSGNVDGDLTDLVSRIKTDQSSRDVVMKHLTPEMQDQLTTSDAQNLARQIEQYVSTGTDTSNNMSPLDKHLSETKFANAMKDAFGDNADKVMAYFEKSTEGNRVRAVDQEGLGAENNAAQGEGETANHNLEETNFEDLYNQPLQLGGKNGEAIPSHETHVATYGNDKSQASRLMTEARGKYPDREVNWTPSKEQPGYGHVEVSPTAKNELALTKDDVQGMRLDTDKYGNSPSRIDTGVKGVTLDAARVTQAMRGKLAGDYSSHDDVGNLQRTARMFHEGMASFQEHYGKPGEDLFPKLAKDDKGRPVFPDNLVIDRRGGHDTTYGDIKDIPYSAEHAVDGRGGSDLGTSEMARKLSDVQLKQDKLSQLEARIKNSGLPEGVTKRQLSSVQDQQYALSKTERGYREALAKRAAEARDQENLSASGQQDHDPAHDNIHSLELAGKVEPITKDMAGDHIDYAKDVAAGRKVQELVHKDGALTDEGRKQLGAKFDKLADQGPSPAAKALGKKGQALLENLDTLSKSDRLKLASTLRAEKASDVAPVVNELTNKYSSKFGDVERNQQAFGAKEATPQEQQNVKDYIQKTLGKSVETEFDKNLSSSGEFKRMKDPQGFIHDTVRVSTWAANPEAVGYHEALHAWFAKLRDQGQHKITDVLNKAAESAPVMNQLRKLLKNEPEALKAIEKSVEERAAYMYQFHQEGKLQLGDATKSTFSKIGDFFKKMFGIWTNDKRAEHIMNYFHTGEWEKNQYNPNAVSRALMEEGTNRSWEKAKQLSAPATKVVGKLLLSGTSNLRAMKNPALDALSDMYYKAGTKAGTDPGYLSAAQHSRNQALNEYGAMTKDLSTDSKDNVRDLLRGTKTTGTAQEMAAAGKVRDWLNGLREDYNTRSGDNIKYRKDYYPGVWDANKIGKDTTGFRAMMAKYPSLKDPALQDQIINHLTRADGVQERSFGYQAPAFDARHQRVLDMITADDRAKWSEDNMDKTLMHYASQVTKRTEYGSRFGMQGQKIDQIMEAAQKKYGATPEQIEQAKTIVSGLEDTLGQDLDPKVRSLYEGARVYENLRLLGMGLFSSAVDPAHVVIRSGNIGDAFTALKRGFGEIFNGKSRDEFKSLAEEVGAVESRYVHAAMGSMYTDGFTSNRAKLINDALFKYNGMDAWSRGMRIAGTESGTRFIAKLAKDGPHNDRWLSELGLKKDDVKLVGGKLVASKADALKYFKGDQAKADAYTDKMHAALNQFVDGAVLRPNKAMLPAWHNDPHWMLLAHMKQFMYAFHHVTLDRVLHEAKNGNYTPMATLASSVPMMMASDVMRAMIQGGGSLPTNQAAWGPEDWLANSAQRAGVFSIAQPLIDAGHFGAGSLLGPTVEQLGDAAETLAGKEDAGKFAVSSLPGTTIYGHAFGGGGRDPTFTD